MLDRHFYGIDPWGRIVWIGFLPASYYEAVCERYPRY